MKPTFAFLLAAALAAGAFTLPPSGANAAVPASVAGAAKKEATIVWYATMNTKDMQVTADKFMATHPGIKVETLRATSAELPARVMTEQRGGKYNADAISGDEFQIAQLISAGAVQRYRASEANKFAKGTYEPNGLWTNLYLNTTVIAWNPQRLSVDHLKAPSSFADFAKPEWKGKFGLDAGAFNWYLGLLQSDKNGNDLVKRIAANNPIKTTGHTATVTQLEAGEFDGTPTAYGYLSDQEKHAGKPVDFVNPKPLFATLNPIVMAKNAPHANAAKVFIEWMLSHDGQQFIAQQGGGEVSSRLDVKSNPAVWDPKHPYVIVHPPDALRYNELVKTFRGMLGVPG